MPITTHENGYQVLFLSVFSPKISHLLFEQLLISANVENRTAKNT